MATTQQIIDSSFPLSFSVWYVKGDEKNVLREMLGHDGFNLETNWCAKWNERMQADRRSDRMLKWSQIITTPMRLHRIVLVMRKPGFDVFGGFDDYGTPYCFYGRRGVTPPSTCIMYYTIYQGLGLLSFNAADSRKIIAYYLHQIKYAKSVSFVDACSEGLFSAYQTLNHHKTEITSLMSMAQETIKTIEERTKALGEHCERYMQSYITMVVDAILLLIELYLAETPLQYTMWVARALLRFVPASVTAHLQSLFDNLISYFLNKTSTPSVSNVGAKSEGAAPVGQAATFFEAMVGIVSCVMIGSNINKSSMKAASVDFMKYFPHVTNIPRMAQAISWLFENGKNVVIWAMRFFSKHVLPAEWSSKLFYMEESGNIESWIDRVEYYSTYLGLIDLSTSLNARLEVAALYATGKRIMAECVNKPQWMVSGYLQAIWKKCTEAYNTMNKTKFKGKRVRPFTIKLKGSTHIGKTHFLKSILAPTLADALGVDPERSSFTRVCTSDYLEPYMGEPIFMIPDLGTAPEGKDYSECMGYIDSTDLVLNYAFDMKGAMFSSVCVLMGSNIAYPTPKELPDHSALWTRINEHMFEVEIAPRYREFVNADGVLNGKALIERHGVVRDLHVFRRMQVLRGEGIGRGEQGNGIDEVYDTEQFLLWAVENFAKTMENASKLNETFVAPVHPDARERLRKATAPHLYNAGVVTQGLFDADCTNPFGDDEHLENLAKLEAYEADIAALDFDAEDQEWWPKNDYENGAFTGEWKAMLADAEYECVSNPNVRDSPFFEANKQLFASKIKRRGFFATVWSSVKKAFNACKATIVSWLKNPLLWAMVVGLGLTMIKEFVTYKLTPVCKHSSECIVKNVRGKPCNVFCGSTCGCEHGPECKPDRAFYSDEELDDLVSHLDLVDAKTEVGVVSGSSVANRLAKRVVAARAVKPKIVLSKTEGQVHEDTVDMLFKHSIVTLAGNGVRMAGLRVKGHQILLPSHFVHQGQFEDGDYITITQPGNGNPTETVVAFNSSAVKYISVDKGDLIQDSPCMWDVGPQLGNQSKDISKFFIRNNDLVSLRSISCALLRNFNNDPKVLVSRAKLIESIGYDSSVTKYDARLGKVVPVNRYYIPRGLEYQMYAGAGACGSPLVIYSAVSPRTIFGVHLSGGYSSLSYGCPVTQEDLECFDKQFGAKSEGYIARTTRTICEMPVDVKLSDDLEKGKVFPEGDYVVHGVVAPEFATRPAGKTQIIPTVLHGAWEVTKEPAVLTPSDPRSESDVSPMQKCLRKYGEGIEEPLPVIYEMFAEGLSETWRKIKPLAGGVVLNLEQAINGMEIDHIDAINMDASPGYPWVLTRPKGEKGKKYLFTQDGCYPNTAPRYIPVDELKQAVRHRMFEACHGRRVQTIVSDQLKDEKRSLQKIKEGNTRMFSSLPVDHLICERMLSMDFVASMMDHRVDQGKSEAYVAIGMDPTGPQFNDLYKRLSTYANWFDGDFKNLDGKEPATILDIQAKLKHEWYARSEHFLPSFERMLEDLDIKLEITSSQAASNVYEVFACDIYNTLHLALNVVYERKRGMPSGHLLTSVFNSGTTLFYLFVAWVVVCARGYEAGKSEMKDLVSYDAFREHVKLVVFGDDFVASVSDYAASFYNFKVVMEIMNQMKIGMTPGNKTAEAREFVPFDEITFLKRSFRIHPGRNVCMGRLDFEAITHSLMWQHENDDHAAMLQQNLEGAMREMVAFGQANFNEFRDVVVGNLTQAGGEYAALTVHQYRTLERQLLAKFD
nr:MAG: polyprotein 2 [Picornavirales sp.]